MQLTVDRIEPLRVRCACPVYRAVASDGRAVFIKVASRQSIERTRRFLAAAGECPLLPHVVDAEVAMLKGRDYLVEEWSDAQRVNAEDMSEAEASSLLSGSQMLLTALAKAPDVVPPAAEDDPSAQYALVAQYACRHPLARRLLGGLLAIPPPDRTYGKRAKVVIHGDLQPKNYGFVDGKMAAVFDFDEITTGVACEDLAYAFTERARRMEISAERRSHLTELFRQVVKSSPWPAEDWRFAVNHCRLRIAARRLTRRLDSFFIAFDIARRDRPLQRLLHDALGEVAP